MHLLGLGTVWERSGTSGVVYEGRDRGTGKAKWAATAVALAFGSNSQLRARAEVYACEDGSAQFVEDFVAAWDKIMTLDRFDLA